MEAKSCTAEVKRFRSISNMSLLLTHFPFIIKYLLYIFENQVSRKLSDRYQQNIGFPNAKHILCLQIKM